MRGFRGSRAVQNVMAFRHGRNVGQAFQGANVRFQAIQGPTAARPDLPEWMKTPETRAVEAMQQRQGTAPKAKHLHLQPVPRSAEPIQQTTAKRGNLKLVSDRGAAPQTIQAAKKKAAPKKAKPKAAPAKKVAKPKAPSRAAPKRKAA